MDVLRWKIALLSGASLVLAACATLNKPPEAYLSKYNVTNPHPARFPVCIDYGCFESKTVSLTGQDWAEVRKIFDPPPTNAEAERARVAKAVAMLETIVGPQANTSGDRGRNPFVLSGLPQLDCISETVNTTTYLFMMQEDGLITWHELRYPQHRGFTNLLWPHNTAVLVDRTTGSAFAVDSWFFDNGQPPEVLLLDAWIEGYQARDSKK
jgi:hypothetical protein